MLDIFESFVRGELCHAEETFDSVCLDTLKRSIDVEIFSYSKFKISVDAENI